MGTIIVFIVLLILLLVVAWCCRGYFSRLKFGGAQLIIGGREGIVKSGPRIVVAISGPRGIDLQTIGKTIARRVRGYAHLHAQSGVDLCEKVAKMKEKKLGIIITGYDLREEFLPEVNEHIHLSYIPYKGARDVIEYRKTVEDAIQKFANITRSEAQLEYQKYFDTLGKTRMTKVVVVSDGIIMRPFEKIISEILQEILILKSAWEV